MISYDDYYAADSNSNHPHSHHDNQETLGVKLICNLIAEEKYCIAITKMHIVIVHPAQTLSDRRCF